MNDIKLLDCTLRDGGHVNRAEFGREAIKGIICDLAKSRIEFIELGFLKDGSFSQDQAIYNRIDEVYPYLPEIEGPEYSLMIRPDWYDISKLAPCNGKIRNLRFAFYYKDLELLKKHAHIAREKGYRIFLNPVNTPGYDRECLKSLLHEINGLQPFGVTMVDTFGALEFKELDEIYQYYQEILAKDITIGLHLHENLGLSTALAQHFLAEKNRERRVIIDGSLYGMGRVPGNLCTENIMYYMNENYQKQYHLEDILHGISAYIEPIKKEYEWGYSPAYFITAKGRMHRSYAEYFLQKRDIGLADIKILTDRIKVLGKTEYFDLDLAEQLYRSYQEEQLKGREA